MLRRGVRIRERDRRRGTGGDAGRSRGVGARRIAQYRVRVPGTPVKQKLAVGPLRIDVAKRIARFEDRTLHLTRKEFDLLAYLAARPDRVVSRQELIDA